jgi:hypothetical protein
MGCYLAALRRLIATQEMVNELGNIQCGKSNAAPRILILMPGPCHYQVCQKPSKSVGTNKMRQLGSMLSDCQHLGLNAMQ